MSNNEICIKGLRENNLKNVDLKIPKEKIVVFTGVSGSGKSSIVFDTIASESQRQMNESYSAFIRSRLPKFPKPHADSIENLTASVIVDQSPLGGNARSTVGTISDMYTSLRLIFSRIGNPYVGTASYFSFNDPNGMCKTCSGLGRVMEIDITTLLDTDKSLRLGGITHTLYKEGAYFWGQLEKSKFFDMDKKLSAFSKEEMNLLLYGNRKGLTQDDVLSQTDIASAKKMEKELRESKFVEGLIPHMRRLILNRDTSGMSKPLRDNAQKMLREELCPDCKGNRLSKEARSCRVAGFTIVEMCAMEASELYGVLKTINDSRISTVVDSLCAGLKRLVDIGLPYISLNRDSSSLSGGEAQRLKLVRYMGSSLSNLTYIFDEPSTGLHPRDVGRMNTLLQNLRDKGNTVLVVEHDKDVISIADHVIDVGPHAGRDGGQITFEGSYMSLLESDTLTGKAMKSSLEYKEKVRKPDGYLTVENASIHNLKNISVEIPTGVMTIVTGVAGSGKSSLISHCFAKKYEDRVVKVDQGPITATNRSMPASYLGFFDSIRKVFASSSGKDIGLFSFNSKGACPACGGKGVIVTELAFMDPVITPCEACGTTRYNDEALSVLYKGKSIVDVLNLTVDDALDFFDSANDKSIISVLKAMKETGLSYMTLGQPLSTLSGGERQRIKLAKYIGKKGSILILDEPTTGLHNSDTGKLLSLFDRMVDKGNTVIIIEHNLEVVKRADWVIDIGPEGGKHGGQVVFTGTPKAMRDEAKTLTAECLRKCS
jgi:excinuclease UvrABC ATPase subunit